MSIEEIASASAYSVAPATPAVAPVAVHHFGDISLLDVRGALPTVAGLARDAVLAQWVKSPAAVLCDLTSVRGPVETGAVALLASVGAQVRQWPGIPIGLICSDRGLRDGLTSALEGQYLAVADTRQKIWGDLIAGAVTATVRAVMAPEAQSVRTARELVAAACTDWGHTHQIPRPRWCPASSSPTRCCTPAPLWRCPSPDTGTNCGWRCATTAAGHRHPARSSRKHWTDAACFWSRRRAKPGECCSPAAARSSGRYWPPSNTPRARVSAWTPP